MQPGIVTTTVYNIQKDAGHWHPARGLEDCEGNSYFQEGFKKRSLATTDQ